MLVESLSQLSRVDESRLLYIASTASVRYKAFEVPKRSGGMRTIHHPSRELKAIQRWLVKVIIARLPVHQDATAYQKGASIKKNAERHQSTSYTTRYDFKDFFPSFDIESISKYFNAVNSKYNLSLSDKDIDFICMIVCRKGQLTIGAPSSPALTNAMMYEFDQIMSKECKLLDLVYSRYADDLFISAFEEKRLNEIGAFIVETIASIDYLKIGLNWSKTAFLSRKNTRRITGVIITSDGKLSIGRDRKREIRALMHQWANGTLPPEKIAYLQGLLAFAFDVEPTIEQSLRRKYGNSAVFAVLRVRAEAYEAP